MLVTPEKLARMRRSIPDLETVTIQGATHMVPQDKPAEFEKAVKTFLSKIEKRHHVKRVQSQETFPRRNWFLFY